MKKLIIVITLLFCTCGCWNYKELDDYSIVTAIAIDKEDEKYEVSILISNAKKNSSDSSAASDKGVVYSGKGTSIYTALKEIGLISPKELYLDHFSILVINEEVAKDGIYNVIDFFLRYPNSRKDFFIALAKDCKAKDTLKIVTPLTDYPSQSIADNISYTSNLQGKVNDLNFNEIVYDLIANSKEVSINSLTIKGSEKKGSSDKNIETTEPNSYIKLGNLGIFKNDKFIKWASEEESIGINILKNKTKEVDLKININDGYVIVSTVEFNSNIKVKLEENEPVFTVETEGNAKIMEVNGDIDLNDNKIIKEIEKKANNKIKNYIKKTIKLSQDNKSDIIGFGSKLFKSNPDYYNKIKNDWNNELKNLKINIKNNIVLKSKSSTQNSVEVLNDKE